tara:strand:+ start:974 stop:1486 length:513 start_codon:yes stop_codon:yes gene_type:complete
MELTKVMYKRVQNPITKKWENVKQTPEQVEILIAQQEERKRKEKEKEKCNELLADELHIAKLLSNGIAESKYTEIKDCFDDWIAEQDEEWIAENIDDLHHECFNTDYYIYGAYKAKEWLGNDVFAIINYVKEYEQFNFNQVTTDFSDPEAIVNMYVYIIGEEIVNRFIND